MIQSKLADIEHDAQAASDFCRRCVERFATHLLPTIWLAAPHHNVAPEVRPKQAALLLQRLDLHGLKLGTLQLNSTLLQPVITRI